VLGESQRKLDVFETQHNNNNNNNVNAYSLSSLLGICTVM